MKEGEYVAEFGCAMPIRWLDESNAKFCDANGQQIMCICGKPATSGIMGKDAYVARCSDCFNGLMVRGE